MKAPNRAALDIGFSYECLQKLTNELVVAFLKFLKGAFGRDLTLIQQDQTVRNRLGAVQIVSHYDGCHVMFRLEFENQFVNLSGTDGIEASGWLVQQQNVRIQRQCTCQPDPLLHPTGEI